MQAQEWRLVFVVELSWSKDAIGKDDWETVVGIDRGVLCDTHISPIAMFIFIAIVIIFICWAFVTNDYLVPTNLTHSARQA